MKTSTVYVVYTFVGLMTGMAMSLLVCGACTAVDGNVIVRTRPPDQDPTTAVFIGSVVAELAAPLISAILGGVLARRHLRRSPRDNDTDNPYPPAD